jgi:hypothetical protein
MLRAAHRGALRPEFDPSQRPAPGGRLGADSMRRFVEDCMKGKQG